MVLSTIFKTLFVVNATYNAMRQQTGFCKMQGYDTISRNTSHGPSLFTSGKILFGVGLSDNQFDGRLCGACIEILNATNLRQPIDASLTKFSNASISDFPFLAMVFDQCTDPICTKDTSSFLDFDVYSKTPPVWMGNPSEVTWKAVPCPVEKHHFIEYLICTPHSCNVRDKAYERHKRLQDLWTPYYFSFTIRNLRIPIAAVELNNQPLLYVDGFGWTFSGQYPINTSFVLELESYDGSRLLDVFPYEQVMNLPLLKAYRGGALLQSQHQI
jgi:hypothetical protein